MKPHPTHDNGYVTINVRRQSLNRMFFVLTNLIACGRLPYDRI
jgi:hypothetical protein